MPNEYVRYAEVTVTGKTGVRTRSWSDGSTKIVQTAQVVHKDPHHQKQIVPAGTW